MVRRATRGEKGRSVSSVARTPERPGGDSAMALAGFSCSPDLHHACNWPSGCPSIMEARVAPLRQRFDFASELRAFAKEVRELGLADRRDPERPIVAKIDLADRMEARAREVMRRTDPVERGEITAETLFTKRGLVPVAVMRNRDRKPGRITLRMAA